MSEPKLYIVDVFAENKYEGNQLAVFRGAGHFSGEEMQRIAKEMNFSETTFIISDEATDGGYDVRIFTPVEEIPFAGHPTLGTAYILQQEIIREPVTEVTLNLAVGQIPVAFSYNDNRPDLMWMTQRPPEFGPRYSVATLSEMLNLDPADFDTRFPVQEVATGIPALIVPLKSMNAVKRAKVDQEKYFALVEKIASKLVLVFSSETYSSENDLNARVFVDYYGIPEDPATGSANGCLAGFLTRYQYWGKDSIDITVEQGYEINRPSRLYLSTETNADGIVVRVGGKVVPVVAGTLL